MTILIRPMTARDVPLGMRLKGQAGWNQTTADWQRFLAMEPEGCLVAELDGVAVGTTVVTAFECVAWISMVLVEQAARGRGVGKALMHRAVDLADELGAKSIRLDATALGQPLYASLGFLPQYELTRFAGVAGPDGLTSSSTPTAVRVASSTDWPAILDVDNVITGTRRGKFLSRLFANEPAAVRVVENRGRIGGYFTVRHGSDAVQLGPCIAETDEAGSALLTDALHRYAGSQVYWDLPSAHFAAVQIAQSAGLSLQRQFLRMCRGVDMKENMNRLWASSGPELG